MTFPGFAAERSIYKSSNYYVNGGYRIHLSSVGVVPQRGPRTGTEAILVGSALGTHIGSAFGPLGAKIGGAVGGAVGLIGCIIDPKCDVF